MSEIRHDAVILCVQPPGEQRLRTNEFNIFPADGVRENRLKIITTQPSQSELLLVRQRCMQCSYVNLTVGVSQATRRECVQFKPVSVENCSTGS